MSRWAYAHEIWQTHFADVAPGMTLSRLPDAASYWQTYSRTLAPHFPPEVFFNLSALRTEAEIQGQARLEATAGGEPLADFAIVHDGDVPVAMWSGQQRAPNLYRMWHTVVHTDYRGRGLYRRIIAATLAYTKALGFDAVTSEHAPCNNPILIAKLRAGFHLYSMELDPLAGPSVNLRYFHNPAHAAAYRFRLGEACLSPALARSGMGAFDQLQAQFVAAGASAKPTD